MHSITQRRVSDHKPKAYRSEKYKKFIRVKKCEVYGCPDKAVAAHIRKQYWGAGTGIKPRLLHDQPVPGSPP